MKWKDKLISSSFPLEYEASKILIKNHFSIDGDYSYSRNDLGTTKDFSVDICAMGYVPYTNKNKISASTDILIECKQRKSSVKWLFLPDANRGDMSSFTLGCTLNAVDQFSKHFFEGNATIDLDKNTPLCYKGIEIDINDGRVYDNELRHGLHQLQYAMPRLFKDNIFNNLSIHDEDNIPFFICSILLTTAPLYVADKTFSINKVEQASNIEDIAKEVPWLVTYLDTSPDFQEHCKKEFKELEHVIHTNSTMKSISEYRKNNGEYDHLLPEHLTKSLQYGSSSYFSQIIVCNINEFPNLIKEIKRITSKATRSKKTHHH